MRRFTTKPKLSELTLREKIGQTAVVQIADFINHENIEEYLKDNPIGNIWNCGNLAMTIVNLTGIVGENLQDSEYYRKWVEKIDGMLPIPVLSATDPMGETFATNFPELVTAPTVAAANSVELAYEYGVMQAKMAKSGGCNYYWAPVMDIPSRFSAISIMRAMSDEPKKLRDLSAGMIKGLQDNGVAATVKHFPGADQTEYRDPHFSPAIIGSSLKEWKKLQGKAFQNMFDIGVMSVMIAHMGFPAVDDRMIGNSYIPATLSDKIIIGLLKKKMGFKGVVITDGIDMAALYAAYPNPEDLFVALLNAGNDILLGVRDLNYIDMIEKAVKDGRISEERINDACSRVLDMKEKLGLFGEKQEPTIMDEALFNEISEHNRKVSELAVTLECDKKNQLPLDPTKIKKVTIVCSAHVDRAYEGLRHMKAALEERGMEVRIQRRIASMDDMKAVSDSSDLIIYAGYLFHHAPMGASSFYGDECATFFFAFTHGIEKSVGVSLGSPYVYYDFYSNLNIFAHAYSLSREAQEAFVKGIFGEIEFKGVMPYIQPGPRKE